MTACTNLGVLFALHGHRLLIEERLFGPFRIGEYVEVTDREVQQEGLGLRKQPRFHSGTL